MPSLDDNNKKGILYITFDVAFPQGQLDDAQREQLAAIIKQPDFKPKLYNGLQGY